MSEKTFNFHLTSCGQGILIDKESGRTVAVLYMNGEPEEAEEEAKMLACSPQMLETLENIVEFASSRDGSAETDEMNLSEIKTMAERTIFELKNMEIK